MKLAILQCADAGPAESFREMLNAVGYHVVMPNDDLRTTLRNYGCDTVLSPKDLTRGLGYDPVYFEEVGPSAMDTCDLYCDIKAHRAYDKVVKRWPRLKGKILWTRINGSAPEHVINERGDMGDEVNPPCPIMTPNQCYQGHPRAYPHWPPFVRFNDYNQSRPHDSGYDSPICLIHNLQGWGYGALTDTFRNSLGIRCYGDRSPDGLIRHSEVAEQLSMALCMVHLKSNDAPGYAIYEAMAAACPVVCTRRLIWRCKMQDLLIPNETCLVFDRETHDALTPDDVLECGREVSEHLVRLAHPEENARIGMNGRNRLKEIMWSKDRASDVESLALFMKRNFA